MEQILLHLFGDYVLQNDWMALNKKKDSIIGYLACFIHCMLYALPFLLITNIFAVALIYSTHYLIDSTGVVTWFLCKRNHGSKHNYGFGLERPPVITVWLNIITDNTFHLIINYFIIKYIV